MKRLNIDEKKENCKRMLLLIKNSGDGKTNENEKLR